MGKKQHSKDRLFITASEWKYEHGGFKQQKNQQTQRLAFDRCALGFTPFTNPVCAAEGTRGVVFELTNIVPYLKKKDINPVTGKPLKIKDLFRLKYHKNTDGEYICPLTYKVLSNNTHIVAIKTSGNVYTAEAIEQLNVKAKVWEDLISGEKFTKGDIITVHDPTDVSTVKTFLHVKEKAEVRQEAPAVGRQ